MRGDRHRLLVALAAVAGALGALGCEPSSLPSVPPSASPVAVTTFAVTAPATAAASPGAAPSGAGRSPEPSAGYFAFDAASIAGYYLTLGYACGEPAPSARAAGYSERSCRLVDPAGRTRVISVVTDSGGDVAAASVSLTGAAGEEFLEPILALDPFAAFLGAFLGERQGESLLTWLAGHLGDASATTTLGGLTIAQHALSHEGRPQLSLEIASQAYLDAPPPSASP